MQSEYNAINHSSCLLKNAKRMKKIFNKIGQVLQLVLAAPVKLPDKVGNVLKYLALGLGIVETVLIGRSPRQRLTA
ncbi:hypothetical protein KUH03_40490 [Sphingobacterium sp. E70]|uniref:hypothetical protein n=1 Tax=Sphingobacterium sp. E70 TaxID=2853439 RepID=UPI00211C5F73|nr:hypothetical protein [Sphingobacterium sp. E70]ULT25072.1 hypothetical protein KUH03_40490 [Sphingobacterium sp. E70]